MENFKLLQVLPSLESGGVEKGTVDLSNYLYEKKYINYIASSGGKLLNHIKDKNFKHIDLPLDSKNFLLYPLLAYKLQKNINTYGINILHIRSRAPAWLMPFLSKKNIFTVSTFHNVYGNQNFLKTIYNKQLGNVNSIVAISEYVKNEIIKKYSLLENKITVINRGTDTNFFETKHINQKILNEFIKKYNIPFNKKIILFPGRITEWKGQIEFLEIIKFFQEKNLFFIFVGDGKNYKIKNKLIKKIEASGLKKTCFIYDNMNSTELRMMYYLSTIVISAPIRPEGFGRTISESLSMRKKILAYNYGGAKDQLDKLDNLYKVQPNNKKDLIYKIQKALQINNEEFENISKISRIKVINYFSKEQMLSKYLELYLGL